MTNRCYRFERYKFKNTLFENTIDATYIIHLENNGRLDNIKNQLSKYKPTNIVYICFNKGYRNCKKQGFITNSSYDLIDAYINVFKHAELKNYNNILILEDDFIFSEEIKNEKHINNINKFLINHNDKIFHYHLGTLPFLLIPYNYNNYRCLSTGNHSVVYSKEYRKYILTINQKSITDWDLYNGTQLFRYKYCYYKPLCYQIFTETENSKNWGKNTIFKDYANIYYNLVMFIFITLKMDKQPEPGFSYFYIFSKSLLYILLLLFILLIYKGYKNK